MPDQFPYPTDSWSTGKMRKNGDSPTMQNMRAIAEQPDIGRAAGAFADNPALKFMEKFVKGQKIAQGQYDTKLSEAEETAFQAWKKKHAPKDSGEDYDFRGAFKAGFKPDPETGHWPDTYKKPNHPTFSDQSIYAKDEPEMAGKWQGEDYKPPISAGGG